MSPFGPKRHYAREALLHWLERLESPWEKFFSEEAVTEGRRLYREGFVREIELQAQNAIVQGKRDDRVEYAVIEWLGNGTPKVRASVADPRVAESVAVAGLHEIEELIADELDWLAGHGQADDPAGSIQLPGQPPEKPLPRVNGHPSAFRLQLDLTVRDQALLLQAYWKGPSGQTSSAFQGQQNIGTAERVPLIRLITLLRKAGFRYDGSLDGYVLHQRGPILEFLQSSWPEWQDTYPATVSEEVRLLTQPPRKAAMEAVVRRAQNGGLDVEWVLRVGQTLLTREQADTLVASPDSYALLPGLGLVSLPPSLRETRSSWVRFQEKIHRTQPPGRYLLFSIFLQNSPVVLDDAVRNWRDSLLQEPALPGPLPARLREYQKQGVAWMAHLLEHECHPLLADEMGLGKTLQVISLLLNRPVRDKPTLVVCPASVIPVWQEELKAAGFPDPVKVVGASEDFPGEKPEHGLWLASYAQLRLRAGSLDHTEFGYAILDEAQFIKNPDAKTTRACFSIRARNRIALSGTPLENSQLDIWSLFHFLMPGLLGTREAYVNWLQDEGSTAQNRLQRQLAPFILRRTKQAVAAFLPPKVEAEIPCPLTPRQAQEYARLCREGLARLGGNLSTALRTNSFSLFSLLTRLRQTCCDPGLLPWFPCEYHQSGKIITLLNKLQEILASGHKAVIFSQFVSLLRRVRQGLEDEFPKIPVFSLTGEVVDRAAPVRAFQDWSGPAVILTSLRAAGTGITLHSADYVFLLDPWWNPAVENQAIDRVHRLGQDKTVFVYRLLTTGTIEERIQRLKSEKRDLFDSIVGQVPGQTSEVLHHFASLERLIQLTASEENTPDNEVLPS